MKKWKNFNFGSNSCDAESLLINIYNANTEQHEPETLQNLFILLLLQQKRDTCW